MGKSIKGALGTIGGGIVGGMFGMPSVGAAIGGSLFGGGGGGGDAYGSAASAQTLAGQQAASASAFRPVGLTTRFGSSNFQMGTDQYGNPIVTGAGYTVSPELQAIQDRLSALFPQGVRTAEEAAQAGAPLGQAGARLFDLGEQYLATSPEEARQKYMQQQYALLDPIRQREEQRLASSVFGRGRAGLNIGDTGQPELYALSSARRQQDLLLAAEAEKAAQQQITYGSGLFDKGGNLYTSMYGMPKTALSPLQSYLGTVGEIEKLGQQPFEMGSALGGRNVNTSGAQSLLQSGIKSAESNLQGELQSQSAGQALLNQFLGGGGTQVLGSLGQSARGLFNPIFPAPISDISIR